MVGMALDRILVAQSARRRLSARADALAIEAAELADGGRRVEAEELARAGMAAELAIGLALDAEVEATVDDLLARAGTCVR
jgi:hypothetical protein